jgi:hypothetical protein
LEVQAAGLGFPLDAWLRIEDASGKELARNDDAGGSDPVLDWTSPETAEYRVVVGNLLQRGGRDQRYRLSIQHPKPWWSASMAEAARSLEPGKTNESKVTLNRRHGADMPLTVSVRGLPAGVRVDPVEVADKTDTATLRWITATNAAPFSGPVSIEVSSSSPATVQEARFSLVSAGENNGVPQGFRRLVVESISRLWLTVLRAPSVPADTK